MIGEVDLTGDPQQEAWEELLLLARRYPDCWCLVGAQMVTLHASLNGVSRPLVTRDLDILVNVRTISSRVISEFLLTRGFALDGASPEGVGHCFTRGRISFDVLSVDNVGERADKTTVPPAHTVEVPGGTQAIAHLETIRVLVNGEAGLIPIPSWVGALLLKSRAAVSITEHRAKHLQDVALLLGLPIDIEPSLKSMTKNEQKYIQGAVELLTDKAWRAVAGAVDELVGRSAAALILAKTHET